MTTENVVKIIKKKLFALTAAPEWFLDRSDFNHLIDFTQDELPGDNLHDAVNRDEVGVRLKELGKNGHALSDEDLKESIDSILEVLKRF